MIKEIVLIYFTVIILVFIVGVITIGKEYNRIFQQIILCGLGIGFLGIVIFLWSVI